MLDSKRQAKIDEATKALYDYIDSLPPGKREKALQYQAMLTQKAAKSPSGMLGVCASELQVLQTKLSETLVSFTSMIFSDLTEKAVALEYETRRAKHPEIHTSNVPSWNELTAEQQALFKNNLKN